MAFFGTFWVNELVVKSRDDASDRALLRSDVEVVRGSVKIRLHHSKTDQLKKGTGVVLGGTGHLC